MREEQLIVAGFPEPK